MMEGGKVDESGSDVLPGLGAGEDPGRMMLLDVSIAWGSGLWLRVKKSC